MRPTNVESRRAQHMLSIYNTEARDSRRSFIRLKQNSRGIPAESSSGGNKIRMGPQWERSDTRSGIGFVQLKSIFARAMARASHTPTSVLELLGWLLLRRPESRFHAPDSARPGTLTGEAQPLPALWWCQAAGPNVRPLKCGVEHAPL